MRCNPRAALRLKQIGGFVSKNWLLQAYFYDTESFGSYGMVLDVYLHLAYSCSPTGAP